VQNPEEVECAAARRPIEDEMSPSSAVSSLIKWRADRVGSRLELAVGHRRIGGQRAERVDERPAIDRCLLSPELLDPPLNDGHKVALGWLREANAPASPPLRHFLAARSPRFDNPIR
jgi:hypothetical protein